MGDATRPAGMGYRTNALIEGQVLEMGAVLSTLVEGKLAATAGSLR